MPTIQQQINQLKKDKETLNTMLNTMGVETTGNETFTQLTPLVGKIVTDPILQDKSVTITENGTTTITADSGYDGLNNVEVTTNVAGSGGGGKYAPRHISFNKYTGTDLEEELANLDESNITNMSSMFATCSNLQRLDLSNFNTNNVTDMSYLFYNSRSLTKLDLSSFDTRKVTTMKYMFYKCTGLKTLILGENFEVNSNTATGNMFDGCTALETLVIKSPNISQLDATAFDGGVPFRTGVGSIYVPDEYVEDYKTRAGFAGVPSVIKPLSQWQG